MEFYQGWIDSVNRRMSDPNWARIYAETCENLRAGYYDQDWVNALFQHDIRQRIDIYEAAAFVEMWTAITSGKVAHATFPIGAQPGADLGVDANTRKLPNGRISFEWRGDKRPVRCDVDFTSEFFGGPSNEDGYVSWRGPMPFFKTNGTRETVWIYEADMPLEVGISRSMQTWHRLAERGCLARWPYMSDCLWLFYTLDDNLWQGEILDIPDEDRQPVQYQQMQMFA